MKKLFAAPRDGFTLIEVILSIAILSIVSVVALRLFIVSYDLNEASRINDMASMIATNTIEDFRLYDDIENLLVSNEWLVLNQEMITGSLYFANDFSNTTPAGSSYEMDCQFTQLSDGLYDLKVTVLQLPSTDESEKVLIEYTTKQYFQERSTP